MGCPRKHEAATFFLLERSSSLGGFSPSSTPQLVLKNHLMSGALSPGFRCHDLKSVIPVCFTVLARIVLVLS